jgi:hypothetical protein
MPSISSVWIFGNVFRLSYTIGSAIEQQTTRDDGDIVIDTDRDDDAAGTSSTSHDTSSLSVKTTSSRPSSLPSSEDSTPASPESGSGRICHRGLAHIHPASTIHRCAVHDRLSSAASQSTSRATSAG